MFIPSSRLRLDWFDPKGHLWLANVFKEVVGSWIVSVLADDSYAYFDAMNTHYAFFFGKYIFSSL